ncbi:hypothetical protein HDU76_009575, partial [Blyttiomyces sp. JEL0837]
MNNNKISTDFIKISIPPSPQHQTQPTQHLQTTAAPAATATRNSNNNNSINIIKVRLDPPQHRHRDLLSIFGMNGFGVVPTGQGGVFVNPMAIAIANMPVGAEPCFSCGRICDADK